MFREQAKRYDGKILGWLYVYDRSISNIAWVFGKESRLTGVNIDQNLDKRHENTTYP